jgi:hypothetical protein
MGVIKTSSVFVAIVLGLFASSARAQEVIAVKVPFAFIVGQHEFPAGEYDIQAADDSGTVFSIEGVDNHRATLTSTNPTDGFDPAGNLPALVFTKFENEYRLSQIWKSTTQGRELSNLSSTRRTSHVETPIGAVAYVIGTERK